MSRHEPVTHALCDMDGLLLDTEIIYTQITQKIVGRFGKTFDWSIKSNMIGRRSEESSRYLVDALALPISPEDYLQERDALLRAAFPHCAELPGARRLISHFSSRGIPIAVASSSSRELYELKTQNHPWFSMFDVVVTGDDPGIDQGKPAPDIFLRAAALIDATPANTLVFEDAPSGLAAATAAGMRTVVVPDPNMDRSCYDGAALILDSLLEFSPADFGLPDIKE
jgi:HAD superfamily hydrolase (TIGR01509 family)